MAPVRPPTNAVTRRVLARALQAQAAPAPPQHPVTAATTVVRSLGALVRRRPAAASPSAAAGCFWNHTTVGAAAGAGQWRRGLASSPAAATSGEVAEQEQEQQRRPPAAVAAGSGASAPASAADGPAPSSSSTSSGPGAAATSASERLARRAGRPAPIQLTERAVARIKELLADKAEASGGAQPLGVRLGIRRRGCNGLSYTLNYASERPKHDEVVESHGVTVFVDPMALMHVVGTVMDYEETELSSEFTFNNPNVKGKCGCGESFSV